MKVPLLTLSLSLRLATVEAPTPTTICGDDGGSHGAMCCCLFATFSFPSPSFSLHFPSSLFNNVALLVAGGNSGSSVDRWGSLVASLVVDSESDVGAVSLERLSSKSTSIGSSFSYGECGGEHVGLESTAIRLAWLGGSNFTLLALSGW
jgi:hypothetical protein